MRMIQPKPPTAAPAAPQPAQAKKSKVKQAPPPPPAPEPQPAVQEQDPYIEYEPGLPDYLDTSIRILSGLVRGKSFDELQYRAYGYVQLSMDMADAYFALLNGDMEQSDEPQPAAVAGPETGPDYWVDPEPEVEVVPDAQTPAIDRSGNVLANQPIPTPAIGRLSPPPRSRSNSSSMGFASNGRSRN